MDDSLNLTGHLLVAMPGMGDSRFERSVVFICSNDSNGSMGFVLNQPVSSPKFAEILDELDVKIRSTSRDVDRAVFRGGPVEQGRGFVIHSQDYSSSASIVIDDLAAVTATLDVLRALVSPKPPESAIMFLGYSGWSKGQLEQEVAQNGWLTMPANQDILFRTDYTHQYEKALAILGVDEVRLSAGAGHA